MPISSGAGKHSSHDRVRTTLHPWKAIKACAGELSRYHLEPMSRRLSASSFRSLLHCPHALFLDHHGNADLKTELGEFEQYLLDEGKRFEQEILAGKDYFRSTRRAGAWGSPPQVFSGTDSRDGGMGAESRPPCRRTSGSPGRISVGPSGRIRRYSSRDSSVPSDSCRSNETASI